MNMFSASDGISSHDRTTEAHSISLSFSSDACEVDNSETKAHLDGSSPCLADLACDRSGGAARLGPFSVRGGCSGCLLWHLCRPSMTWTTSVRWTSFSEAAHTWWHVLQRIIETSPCRQQLRHNVRRTGWCEQGRFAFLQTFSSGRYVLRQLYVVPTRSLHVRCGAISE